MQEYNIPCKSQPKTMTHIYLDHSATTPVHPAVLEAMLPYWTAHYGNPSSIHQYGRQARRGLEQARQTIARLLNAQPNEIIFTSCGSESDNLALRGAMWQARGNRGGNHLICSAIEHEAVLKTAQQLRDQFKFELTILPVDHFGQIDMEQLQGAIRSDTVLISIMAANNEIGTTQPIEEIGAIARQHNVLFHTDAVQAAPFFEWDMAAQPIDMMSFAPHKFNGPKGVGILYVREGTPLKPMVTGGGQESGLRAGTSNVAFAVGGAAALRIASENREAHVAHCTTLRDSLIAGILGAFPESEAILTGHPVNRLPHHASFAFKHAAGNDLLIHLDVAGIAGSSGSACAAGNPEPSPTLQALGLDDAWATGGLRLTVGRQNTEADVAKVVAELPEIVARIQQFTAQ